MISFKTFQANDSGAEKEPERYISLFNISLLEPPQPEIKPVLPAPAVITNTVSGEALAENFM